MIRVLVPIEALVRPSLAAIYFALEFAKRHPAKVYFLILAGAEAELAPEKSADPRKLQEGELFAQLLERARQQQVEVEVLHAQEDYLTAVCRVVLQQGIDDLVVAVPPLADPTYHLVQRRLEQLRHRVPCHIITVKPKEAGSAGTFRQPPQKPEG
jgi:hypothetical protein